MKQRIKITGLLLGCVGFAACLPMAGDADVDRNKDGVEDAAAGGVRGIDEVLLAAPTSPTINIFGALHHGYTGEPVAGATITVLTSKQSELTTTSNESGGFQISAVSPGQYVIHATVEGFGEFRAVLTAADPGGNTDNTNQYIGKIYLLPTDGTWSYSVYTEDGRPVANATMYVDVPSVWVDQRTNAWAAGDSITDLARGFTPGGFRTVVATTNAQGVAQVTGVPDVKKMFYFLDNTFADVGPEYAGATFTTAWVGTQDLDNDGFMDVGGSLGAWHVQDFFHANGKVALPPLPGVFDPTGTTLVPVVNGAGISGNVIVDNSAALKHARAIGTSESLVIIFNQPIDIATASIQILNDWANNRNTQVTNRLDNSTPVVLGQGFPVSKALYETKPVDGGAQTLVPSVDPSGTVLTLTPTVPWQPGAEYIITGQITSARHAMGSGKVYVFNSRARGFFTTPAAELDIEKVFVERNDAGDNYDNLVIELNDVVTGYNDGANQVLEIRVSTVQEAEDYEFILVAPNGATQLVTYTPGAGDTGDDIMDGLFTDLDANLVFAVGHSLQVVAGANTDFIRIEAQNAGDEFAVIGLKGGLAVTNATPAGDGPTYILVCAEQDFGFNGPISTTAAGEMSLDQGECPPTDYLLRGADVGVGLVRATLRANSAQTKLRTGRFWELAPQKINASLSGKKSVNLRVYVNPLVDGQQWAGTTPENGTHSFMSTVAGDSYKTKILKHDVVIAPTSAKVSLELPTNNPPVFE